MRGLKHILAGAGLVAMLLVTSTANGQNCNIGPPPQVRASAINSLAIPAQTDVAVAAPSLNLSQIALSAPVGTVQTGQLAQVAARPAAADQAGIFRRRCRGGGCGRLELDRNASLAFAGRLEKPPALGVPGSKLASR